MLLTMGRASFDTLLVPEEVKTASRRTKIYLKAATWATNGPSDVQADDQINLARSTQIMAGRSRPSSHDQDVVYDHIRSTS